MATYSSDYACEESLPNYEIIDDQWFIPNIWGEDDDENYQRKYDGWLNKPQYRILTIQQIKGVFRIPYIVLNETYDRSYVGSYSCLEEAHKAGKDAASQ